MTAPRQLTGKPQRLTLASAPTPLRIDVQHSQAHGAQLPRCRDCTQVRAVSPTQRSA
jgi:hypothetical protein